MGQYATAQEDSVPPANGHNVSGLVGTDPGGKCVELLWRQHVGSPGKDWQHDLANETRKNPGNS